VCFIGSTLPGHGPGVGAAGAEAAGIGTGTAAGTYGTSGMTSASPAPWGTIGKTFSSRATWNSMIAGSGYSIAFRIAGSTSPGMLARQAGMPYASASLTKSGGPDRSTCW
jgi:hypothetical protein